MSSSSRTSFTTTAAAWTVPELLSKSYIQNAFRNEPKTPKDVLSFFFGVDFKDKMDVEEKLVHGDAFWKMKSLWFGGGEEYDSVCYKHFAETIRRAGRGELQQATNKNDDKEDDWSETINGLVAQIILCDQLSRNAFRGMSETYIYDEISLELAGQLCNHILDLSSDEAVSEADDPASCSSIPIQGKLYPVYISVIILALMHSENIQDHNKITKVLQYAKEISPPPLLKWWNLEQEIALEHKQVVQEFGRYPHRNKLKGRTSTQKEMNWLADVENLPGWAKG